MTEQTVTEALEGSILKWEAIVNGTGVDDGAANCPLCHMFLSTDYAGGVHRDENSQCNGCPVKIATGRGLCHGTPYYDYADKFDDSAAKRELEFLKSLRDIL